MNVVILGGFLGSGKTTMLMHLAKVITRQSDVSRDEIRIAIIENEIGTAGIDDKMLGGGYAVKNLFAGCACCTLAGELCAAVDDIGKKLRPEWLIIEATGVAYPGGIKRRLQEELALEARIITLVDASRWRILSAAMESLVSGQLEDASAILINKIDLVSYDTLIEVETSVKGYNETAPIYAISAEQIIGDDLWNNILCQPGEAM